MGEKHNCMGNFLRKFSKVSLENSKNALFWSIFKIISKPYVNFHAFWRKTQLFRKFLIKFSKTSFGNCNKCISLFYFQNPELNFRSFWRKTQLFGKFVRKFSKISLANSKNALFLSIFKIISNYCVKFSSVLTKNYFWDIFEKIFNNFLRK